jgi:hypothetical protein
MKKFISLIIISLLIISGPLPANVGNVTVTLVGIDPLTVNIKGDATNEEAGNITIYLYFRDDGVTDLQVGGVDGSQLSGTGAGQFGWTTAFEVIQFEGEGQPIGGGPWTKGTNTYTRRVLYDNTGVLSLDDYWTTAGINALVYDFTTIGSGHAFIEVAGTDGLTDWAGSDPGHTVHYANQDVSLPVELSSFNAEIRDNYVNVNWITESEINNLGFEVYRAPKEEAEYILLSSYETNPGLEGHGNSSNQNEYNYIDESVEEGQTYWYQLVDVDYNGNKAFHAPISVTLPKLPDKFQLYQNYPNPFNPTTTFRFDIPRTEEKLVDTKLIIYNSLGQLIKNLYNENLSAGSYEIKWDGTNDFGNSTPTGIYFAVFRADGFTQIRKLVLIK